MRIIYLTLILSFLAPLFGAQSSAAHAAQSWDHSFTSTGADGSTLYETVEVSISDDGTFAMSSSSLRISESGDLIESCSELRIYSPGFILPTTTVKDCTTQRRLSDDGADWHVQSETLTYEIDQPLF